jgi:elongation factor P
MLSYNELRPGHFIAYEGSICEVLDAQFLRMQQRKPVMKVKLRDLVSGKVKETSFQQSDELEEAEIERMQARFLYENKGEYWFDEVGNPKNRFKFTAEQLGNKVQFLKPQTEVTQLMYGEKTIGIQLPVKMEFKVVMAPPAIRGNTSSGGNKQVEIETGAMINTPLFIEEGDVIRVNTETGLYAERVEKA